MNDDEVVYELATPPQGAPPKHFSCTQASRRPSPSLSSPPRPLLRERAVDLTPANIIHAPAAKPQAKASPNAIERHVGKIVAAAAGAILEALHEYQNGGRLSSRTKMAGGDLLAQLYALRCYMIADWPFDDICREHGKLALRAADVPPSTANTLVDEVLILLHKIVRAEAN